MNAHRSLFLLAAASILAVTVLVSAQDAKPASAPMPKITGKSLITVEELKWAPLPGITGAEFAKLVGDPTKEAHRAFFKYPVGLKSPMHSHSFGDRGVVVSGTLSLAVEGAPAKKLGPGSFFSLGSGVQHVTTVEGTAPCVFYMEREGAFDVVAAPEKDKEKDKGKDKQ